MLSPSITLVVITIILIVFLFSILKLVFNFFDTNPRATRSAAPRIQKTPRPPKPKKVKEQKIKEPKKVKEPKAVKSPAPSASAADAQTITKIKQIQHQIASINSMIRNIDTQFQSGSISQQEYMQKKSFLSEKLGGLQAELEQLRS